MAFTKFSDQSQGVQLLQRSLARGRLGHAYLFTGDQLEELETLAGTLAKTLNCLNPVKTDGVATDCCDDCLNCKKSRAKTTPTSIGRDPNPRRASFPWIRHAN